MGGVFEASEEFGFRWVAQRGGQLLDGCGVVVLLVSIPVRRVLGYPVGALCGRGCRGLVLQVAVVWRVFLHVFEPWGAVGVLVFCMRVCTSIAVGVAVGFLFDDVQGVLWGHASEGHPQPQRLCSEGGFECPVEGQVREALGEVDVDRGVHDYPDVTGWIVVAVTVSARMRSLPWEDAPKLVAPLWRSTWRPSTRRVMRTEAQPTVGVRCWVPDASVK